MDDKIAAERAFLIEVMAEALVKKLAEEREAWEAKRSDELRQLKIEVHIAAARYWLNFVYAASLHPSASRVRPCRRNAQ